MTDLKRSFPVVYHPRYKLGTSWLKHLHKLDLDKSGDLYRALLSKELIAPEYVHRPEQVTQAQLYSVHDTGYICDKLTDKNWLSKVFQVEAMAKAPYFLSRHYVLIPVLYHTGGTILAGELALEKGWAINLGGGAHHAHAKDASGFCAVADISISIKQLRRNNKSIQKVMIIDLDAHQGNGHERDFLHDPDVYILDMFTYGLLPNGNMFYPNDEKAMERIDAPVRLDFGTQDDSYLQKLSDALAKARAEFSPDIIYYVAGADILEGDILGKQNITKAAFIKRDEMVFSFAQEKGAAIAVVQAGGYQPNLGAIVADSIEHLHLKFGLFY